MEPHLCDLRCSAVRSYYLHYLHVRSDTLCTRLQAAVLSGERDDHTSDLLLLDVSSGSSRSSGSGSGSGSSGSSSSSGGRSGRSNSGRSSSGGGGSSDRLLLDVSAYTCTCICVGARYVGPSKGLVVE